MLSYRFRRHQQLVERIWRRRWFVGKILSHHRERNKYFVDVPAVVARVLFLLRHHPEDGVWDVVEVDRLIDGVSHGKQLLGGVAAQESDSASFVQVFPVVEAAATHIQAADLAEGRVGTGHQEGCGVEGAVRAHIVLTQLRDCILAVRRLLLHIRYVAVLPVYLAAGTLPACLEAGSAVENDHDVFAQRLRLLLLPDAEPLAGSDHQNDGNNAPRDTEHRQERTQLVHPQGSKHVANEIAEEHGNWTNITAGCEPSPR